MAKSLIKPSKVGSLRAIARKEGGLQQDGSINKNWARKKMSDPNTPASTKKKINFFINFNQ